MSPISADVSGEPRPMPSEAGDLRQQLGVVGLDRPLGGPGVSVRATVEELCESVVAFAVAESYPRVSIRYVS